MAVSFLFGVPGLTREQYESVLAATTEGLGEQGPPGALCHAAGPMDGGWWVFESWESDEAAQAFYTGLRDVFDRRGVPQPQAERLETLNFFGAPTTG